MYVGILPVSGGGFVCQLAILRHLCESHIIPDVCFASSGGNVSAYIALAADWQWAGISRIARTVDQSLFAKPWSSIASLSFIIGYFKGNVYNNGTGVRTFLQTYFTSSTIQSSEIWTGTYNQDTKKARLFCNRGTQNALLKPDYIDYSLTQSMDPVFASGHIETIAIGSIASASIPAIVPPQDYEGQSYVDGGVAGASPLGIMQGPLLTYVSEKKKTLHLLYINSIDLDHPNQSKCNNILDNWRQAVADLVRTQNVADRLMAFEILRCHSGKMHVENFACTYSNLERVKNIQGLIYYSLLEIYPYEAVEIDIVHFNGEDVITAVDKVYGNCGCRFWWLEIDNVQQVDKVRTLLSECQSVLNT